MAKKKPVVFLALPVKDVDTKKQTAKVDPERPAYLGVGMVDQPDPPRRKSYFFSNPALN